MAYTNGIMDLDKLLLVVAIACYVTGTLVFAAYFLTRAPLMRTLGIPLAVLGCVAQFAELLTRWQVSHIWPLTNLYGSLSLFSAMGVLIFLIFAAALRALVHGRLRAADRGDRARIRDDVERRLHAAGPRAAVVLDQGPRAARHLGVRSLHGRFRLVGALPDQVRVRSSTSAAATSASPRRRGGGLRSAIPASSSSHRRARAGERSGAAQRHAGHHGRGANAATHSAQWLAQLPSLAQARRDDVPDRRGRACRC